jgi:RNA polymerase-binding transcription factor DksA
MKSPHSEAFIADMKQRLLTERDMIVQELKGIARKEGDDYTAKYPEYGEHEDENASEVTDYQAAVATTEATQARLESIEQALARIEEGTYGLTREGEPIPEQRLRANPAATTLVK